MTCDNCSADALYTVNPPYRNAMNFCETHIPEDLIASAYQGLYPVPGSEKVVEVVSDDSLDS